MQNTTQLYKTILQSVNCNFDEKVSIAGTEYGKDALCSMKTSISAFGDGSPVMGLAPSREIDVALYADSADIPRMATIIPYAKATDPTQSRESEWIQKGVFYTDTRQQDEGSGIIRIHGYDKMLTAETNYPSTNHVWPYTDILVVNEIAQTIEIQVDARTTALMTAGFQIPFPAQRTMREMLAAIAGLYGGSFIISDTNTLLLVCFWNVSSDADVHDRRSEGVVPATSETLSPALPPCTGIRYIVDDGTEVLAGDDTGYVFEIQCPFAKQETATWLLNRMRGFVYHPYSMFGALIDPAADVGDAVYLGEETVIKTESTNQLVAPVRVIMNSDAMTKYADGYTFTRYPDGSLNVSGRTTATTSQISHGTPIGFANFEEPITGSIIVTVEAATSFPDKVGSSNLPRLWFDLYDANDGFIGSYSLAGSVISQGKRVFFKTQSVSGASRIVFYFFYGSTVSGDQYYDDFAFNHTIYFMVALGQAIQPWESPIGTELIQPYCSGLWNYSQNFDPLCAAEIGAPYEQEIDHEYPFVPRTEREYKRRERNVESTLYLLTDRMESVVEELAPVIKNLLPCPYYSSNPISTVGVLITFNANGSFDIEGTSTMGAIGNLTDAFSLDPGKYVFSFACEDATAFNRAIFGVSYTLPGGGAEVTTWAENHKTIGDNTVYYLSFDCSSRNAPISVRLRYDIPASGISYDDTFYPMVEAGTSPTKWDSNNPEYVYTYESRITQLADSIDLKVSHGDVSSEISMENGEITITGDRITITSTNFSVTRTGVITATAGTIGGWTITDTSLENLDEYECGAVIDSENSFIKFMSYADASPYVDTGLYLGQDPDNYYRQSIIFSKRQSGAETEVAKIYATPFIQSNRIQIELPGSSDAFVVSIGGHYTLEVGNDWCNINTDYFEVRDLYVYGDLAVQGQKDRAVGTKSHGTRRITAYETAEPYFGDIGNATTDENGECVVPIDAIFAEMVDLESEYQVFLQKEGPGDLWVDEKVGDHFTVKGTPGLKFAWELKAKQIDHNGRRLELYVPKGDGGAS